MSSSQALEILDAEIQHTYYLSSDTLKVQAIPVSSDTKFTQSFTNLNSGGGVSQFTISPGNGLRHVVIVLEFTPAAFLANSDPGVGANQVQQGKYALPKGWGYSMVAGLNYRIAGSPLYSYTGAQLLQRALSLCKTSSQAEALLQLGGNEVKTAADFLKTQRAYVVVPIWASPECWEVAAPLPADLLASQIIIQAQVAPFNTVFVTHPNPGALTGGIPNALADGYFQLQQYSMEDKSMSLAVKENMNGNSYNYPMPTFDQAEVVLSNLNATTARQAITATGFRNGELLSIEAFLTKKATAADPTGLARNVFVAPESVEMIYMGRPYAVFNNHSSSVWCTLQGTKPPYVTQSLLNGSVVGAAMTSTPVTSEWVSLRWCQEAANDSDVAQVRVHGITVNNGQIQLTVALPDADTVAGGSASAYDLHLVYRYNATLTFSASSADYVF